MREFSSVQFVKSQADSVVFSDLAVREPSKKKLKETLLGELAKISLIYPPQGARHDKCHLNMHENTPVSRCDKFTTGICCNELDQTGRANVPKSWFIVDCYGKRKALTIAFLFRKYLYASGFSWEGNHREIVIGQFFCCAYSMCNCAKDVHEWRRNSRITIRYFWLDEKMARVFLNQSLSAVMLNQSKCQLRLNYFRR